MTRAGGRRAGPRTTRRRRWPVGVAGGLGGLEVLHDGERHRAVVRDEPRAQRAAGRRQRGTGPGRRSPAGRCPPSPGDDGDRRRRGRGRGCGSGRALRASRGSRRRRRGSAGASSRAFVSPKWVWENARGPSCEVPASRSRAAATSTGRCRSCPPRGGERCGEAGVEGRRPARRGPGPRGRCPRARRCAGPGARAAAAAHGRSRPRPLGAPRRQAVDGAVTGTRSAGRARPTSAPGVVAEPGRRRRPAPGSGGRRAAAVRAVDHSRPSQSGDGTAGRPGPVGGQADIADLPRPVLRRGERPVRAGGCRRPRASPVRVADRHPDEVRHGRGLRGSQSAVARPAGRRVVAPRRGSAGCRRRSVGVGEPEDLAAPASAASSRTLSWHVPRIVIRSARRATFSSAARTFLRFTSPRLFPSSSRTRTRPVAPSAASSAARTTWTA